MTPDDIGVVVHRLELAAAYGADRRALAVTVLIADLTAVLRELAARTTAYNQRGEAFERVAGTYREPTPPSAIISPRLCSRVVCAGDDWQDRGIGTKGGGL